MTRSPFSRLRALVIVSIVSVALLASGCAQGGSNEASTGGASAPPTQAAGAASGKPSGGPASAKPEPTGPVTDWATVTADASSLSFSAPADWSAYNTFDDTTNQEIANHLETDVTSIQNSTRLMDLMTLAPARDDLGVMEGVFCMKLTLPLDATTIESTVRKSASNSGGNVDVFTSTESANGTVYYGIVSSPDNYALVGHVYLPNSSGSYVTTYIYASSTERLQALISSVATTLR